MKTHLPQRLEDKSLDTRWFTSPWNDQCTEWLDLSAKIYPRALLASTSALPTIDTCKKYMKNLPNCQRLWTMPEKNDVFHWDLANDNKDPLLWKSKGNAKNSIPALLAEVWGISEICQ